SGANVNHLELLSGEEGIRIVSAVVDITGDFNVNNTKLTLDGSGASSIKAVNITIGNISALNNTDKILVEAGSNIFVNGTIDMANTVTLEAVGNITVSGKITAYQLTAKAPTGTVSIDAVEINLSNNGNERENAAIYIVADNFIVTTTSANSIIPGGAGGHLCLTVNTQWADINGVVDGIEGVPGTLGARWHQHISGVVITGEIIYSFTEDSNGNGKLDRIRVQSNYAMNGDFSDFDITVEGYMIDRSKGTDGFQMVSAVTGKTPFDYDSFYIYLKEASDIDGGNTPLWTVTRNTSLLSATGTILGDPAADKNIKPIDTIPPRIAYTLTLPGHPQTYAQISEPAISDSGVVSASFDGVSNVNAQSAGLGYLFEHSNSYMADDLASLPDIYQDTAATVVNGYFKIDSIVDKEPKPDWSVINPACPPKYPLNWGYTVNAKVINEIGNAQSADGTVSFSNVFTPPNKLLTVDMMTRLSKGDGSLVTPNTPNIVIRRVTDVMISIAPSTANSSNSGGDDYFVWPVWAKPRTINAGTIWQFDGTAYLEKNLIEENNGIELQARIKNNNMTGNLEFFWTMADIPADTRNPKEATEAKKVGGLWLPNVSGISPLYYYVLLSDGINKNSASSSSQLFNFDITSDALVNSKKFEFIFRFANSDMFAARLDSPPGVIPNNWYALIRPFSFDIQSIRQQRGGVTIMNNVINSDKKETAYIRYNLPRSGRVTIQIYTLDGSLVKSIRRNEHRETGTYVDTWDGSNNGGRAVARGMYFVRVVGPDIDEIRKIMVVK
ncbi:FlgD immunoglobulin-like domain containing protein, partial [Treponema sp. R80B11-R83G3]